LDNHDQVRFLSVQSDLALYRAALAYVFMAQGIPIVYYGSEQGFNGGADPDNREPLWPTKFNNQSGLYQYIAQLNRFRKQWKLWNYPQIQRYAADSFYAFTVGKAFVALTNAGSNGPQQHFTITYHPYAEGQTLCNLFWPQSDCVVVKNNQFDIFLNNGETKVRVTDRP
jgi:alpha-amylase